MVEDEITAINSRLPILKKLADRYPSLSRYQENLLVRIPKVEEALAVLGDGVEAIAVVGAGRPGAFAAIARGDGSEGTRIRVG